MKLIFAPNHTKTNEMCLSSQACTEWKSEINVEHVHLLLNSAPSHEVVGQSD